MASLSPEAQAVLAEDGVQATDPAPEGSFSPGYPEAGQKTEQSSDVVVPSDDRVAALEARIDKLTEGFNNLPQFLMQQFQQVLGGGDMNALISQLGGQVAKPQAQGQPPAAPGQPQPPAMGGGFGGGDWLSQLTMLLGIAERVGLIKPKAVQQGPEPVEVAMDQLSRMLSLFGGFKQMVFEEFRNTGSMMRSMRDVFGRDYLLEGDSPPQPKGKEGGNDSNRGKATGSQPGGTVRRQQTQQGKTQH
jgi:hypothetical protein